MRRSFLWLAGTLVAATIALFWLFRTPERSLPRTALARQGAVHSTNPAVVEQAATRNSGVSAAISPSALPSSRFQPRDPQEWQGMLLHAGTPAPCESADGCGVARACKGGKCVACEVDGDCANGEGCVLDHCLRKELISCRRRADCERDSLCILSGYSAQRRGNETMRSFCVSKNSGTSSIPNSEPPSRVDTRKSLPDDELLKRASKALNAD